MPNAYILSVIPAGYGDAVSLLAEMLVAAGWSYKASGDGLAAYSATGKVFTGVGAGAGGWNNARAWARLSAPDARREIVIQHNAANGLRVKYSPLAKFTGGTPAANTTPSATDERMMFGGGTDASPTHGAYFSSNTPLGSIRAYGHASNVAPYGFWYSNVSTPAGALQCGMMLDPVTGVPEDPDPVVFHIGTTQAFARALGNMSGSNGNNAVAWPVSGGTTNGSWCHMDVAMSAAAFVNIQAGLFAVGLNNNDIGTAGSYLGGSNCFLMNPFNGKHETYPIMWGRMAGQPNPGMKGWSNFLRWTTIQRVTVADTLGGLRWVCMGNVWLPWDGVTVPLV